MKEFVDKLIERLEEEYNQAEKDMGLSDTYNEASYCDGRMVAYKKAKYIVKALAEEHKDKDCSKCSRRSWYQKGYEDAKKNNGWIPVSERLPKTPKENPIFDNKPLELYLVTVRNADYSFRAFWNGKVFTDGFGKLDVIAWQPLPQPYKEGE